MNETAATAAALTSMAVALTCRRDLVVHCVNDPDAPPGHFQLSTASVTINAAAFTDMDLTSPRIRGVLLHEIGHAEHTPRRGVPARLAGWVDCLEEPRIERAMLTAHPDAAEWLQASAVMATPTQAPRDAAEAAEALILTFGRIAAGVAAAGFAGDLITCCAGWFADQEDMQHLEAAITAATTVADTDLDSLLTHASTIADIVDRTTGGNDVPPPGGHGHSHAQPVDNDHSSLPPHPPADTSPEAGMQSHRGATTGPADEHTAMVSPIGTISTTLRPPTNDEVRQAIHVGSWLTGPTTPRSVVRGRAAAAPPGRLHMPELVRAHAQLDMGLQVTARPWTRLHVEDMPTTPIEVGVIIDRSHSMRHHLDHVAGVAWIISQALTSSGRGRSCLWGFSDFAEIIPTSDVHSVVVPDEGRGSSALPFALADYSKWSSRQPNTARTLAIISDGALQGPAIDTDVDHLASTGVRVVWFTPRGNTPAQLPASATHVALDEANLIHELLSATRGAD